MDATALYIGRNPGSGTLAPDGGASFIANSSFLRLACDDSGAASGTTPANLDLSVNGPTFDTFVGAELCISELGSGGNDAVSTAAVPEVSTAVLLQRCAPPPASRGPRLARLRPGGGLLGGEQCFCTREAGVGDAAGSFGALDREAIRAARLQLQFAERPSLIAGHAFTTGRIPAESFERVLAPSRTSVGVKNGVGCVSEGLPEAKRSATTFIRDDFQHEQATAYLVKDKGPVVMTSCGHRGIVNSVRTAQKLAGVTKVHAIVGGFHLAPHAAEYQRQTVQELKALEPDWLIPMHCSGEVFIAQAMQELGDKVVRSSTGTRLTFGAV